MIDWESIREECIQTGQVIRVDKPFNYVIPDELHESNLGLDKGAFTHFIKTNIEQFKTNSVNIEAIHFKSQLTENLSKTVQEVKEYLDL